MLPDRVDDVRRTLRQVLLRHRRLLAALLVGVAAWATLGALAPAPPATIPVLVAAADLPAGKVLTAGDLTTADYPPGSVPDGMAEAAYAVGRTTAGPVRRGEPVTEVRLVGESILAGYPGLVAVPVRLADPEVADLLRVGDRIDLMAVDPSSGSAHRVATDTPIIAIPDNEGASQAIAGAGRLIVVGTTPQTSTKVTSSSITMYLTAVFSR